MLYKKRWGRAATLLNFCFSVAIFSKALRMAQKCLKNVKISQKLTKTMRIGARIRVSYLVFCISPGNVIALSKKQSQLPAVGRKHEALHKEP
jgi:hypothetical protein